MEVPGVRVRELTHLEALQKQVHGGYPCQRGVFILNAIQSQIPLAPRHRRGPWWGEDWALQTGNIDALDQGTYRRNEDGTWERSGLNIDITYSVGVNGVGDGKGNIIKGTEVYILYIDEIENGYVVSTASL